MSLLQSFYFMRFCLNILFLSLYASLLFACNINSEQNIKEEAKPNPTTTTDSSLANNNKDKIILFFGNSLTAGYGLDPSESFPTLIQKKLDSLDYNYKVINAGLSGETTASGNNRLNWVLERQPVDIFVLELGANDGLRGIDPEETRKNLEEMIDKVRKAYPEAKIMLAGMMVPPNMGREYSNNFRQIFPEIAQEKNVELIPFLLENVAGESDLNQADGIHPTAEGQKIVADNVWKVLKEMINTSA